MFQAFTVKHFRGFHDLTIAPLACVNLIAGQNNVGKTALLEALLLHTNPNIPEVALTLNIHRGIRGSDGSDMWHWLFTDRQIIRPIELTSVSEDEIHRTLRITLDRSDQAKLTTINHDSFSSSPRISLEPDELVLEYQDTTGKTGTTRARIKPDKDGILQVIRFAIPVQFPTVFISTVDRLLVEVPEWWSELEAVGRQDEIVSALHMLEPRLRRLTVLVRRGSVPMVYGDIGIGELVPVSLMGEGIGRLLAILLAIASVPGGMVLIDEVENGFHHSVMVAVWQAIALAARRAEVQIFATTHSWECIQAAHTAFELNQPYDVRLHRLERIDHTIQAITYDHETLSTSIGMNLETR